MRRRLDGCVRALAAAMLVAGLPHVLAAPRQPPRAAARPSRAASPSVWTVPRTPWGDPDLQGTFTNTNEYATPLERPDSFAGRGLQDLTDEDLARVRRNARQDMVAALPGGRVRGPDEWWLQSIDVSQRHAPWLVVDPPDGRIPPLTPDGERRSRARVRSSFVGGPFDGPQDLNFLERCISRSVPGSMIPVMYGNNYEILQTPGWVAIRYEIIHETRMVPLDGRPHVAAAITAHMGDPRGRWEGTTLVVETTNFKPENTYRASDAATLRVTERFTPVAPDRLDWSARIEDPRTWTRPWTIAMPLMRDPEPLLPYDCHEHNYGLANILRAARAQEH